MRIGVLGSLCTALVGPSRSLLEERNLRLVRLFQVMSVYRLRLYGGVDARAAGGTSGFYRLFEISRMVMA